MITSIDMKMRYVAGAVTPIGPDRHSMPQPQPLLPPDIRCVSCSIEISDYTREGVDELVAQGANSITLCGLPFAAPITQQPAATSAIKTYGARVACARQEELSTW
jgi:hypothetical protein